MNGIDIFFILLGLIVLVIQIMFFVKIWQMTDNVAELTRHFCGGPARSRATTPAENRAPVFAAASDPRLDTVKKGDKVRRRCDGAILTVNSLMFGMIGCKGDNEGLSFYDKNTLEYIEQ